MRALRGRNLRRRSWCGKRCALGTGLAARSDASPPVGRFVADLRGLERRLAVAVAGAIQASPQARDTAREAGLAGAGWRVLRLPHAEAPADVHRVVATIRAALWEPWAEPPEPMDSAPTE